MTQPGSREMATLTPPAGADRANQDLRAIQFRAVTAFNRLRDDVARLGTPADTPDLRRRVASGTQRFNELAQQFLAAAAKHPSKDSTATQKIVRDFRGLLRSSERLMGSAREKEAASLPHGAAAAASAQMDEAAAAQAADDAERAALLAAERRAEVVAVEGELRFNEALIEERDAAITEITGQIGEVHQIFQDLAVLVHDQGEALDDIEANLTRAAAQTGDAHVQVMRAERHQRRARNTWCFLMALAAGAVGILLLIILA